MILNNLQIGRPIVQLPFPIWDLHDGHWDEDEFSEALDIVLGEEFLHGKADLANVTSGGFHIGSATTHLQLSRLVLRKGGHNLTSRSVVKTKEVFYESPVLPTPYRADGVLDGEQLKAFLHRCYDEARLIADLIQTGVVVVSGKAADSKSRPVIEEVFGREVARFLFITEKSKIQGMLAAFGAGAVDKSGNEKKRVLNVDLGAEGARFAWIANGSFESFYSTSVGAKVLGIDEQGMLSHLDETGQRIVSQLGLNLQIGQPVTRSHKQAVGRFLGETLLDYLEGEGVSEEGKIVFPSPPPSLENIDYLQFSGGVAEYVYGYETEPGADVGFDWGTTIRKRAPRLGVKMGVLTPVSRLRATPVGVATYSVHLPLDSIFCSHGHLHVFKNLMVVAPKFPQGLSDSAQAQRDVEEALSRFDSLTGSDQPFALSLDYADEESSYDAIAAGLAATLVPWNRDLPLVLVGETAAACAIAKKMASEDSAHTPIVGLSGFHSHDMDFIEVGEVGHDTEVPVVVRSLVFR